MNVVLCKLVIACLIAGGCSQNLFPDSDGCSQSYDEYDDTGPCIHTIYCKNIISFSESRHEEACNNLVYIPNYGGNFDPVNIVFKSDENIEMNVQNLDFRRYLITSLDLSDNNYISVPTLERMENLKILKIARCALSTAKLSNINELSALTDLDYSQNAIDNIQVVPGEYEYKTLKTLNMSHNKLANIPEGAFDSFANIESLDLSHNRLYKLDIMDFDGIKKLLHLNLSYNEIGSLDSLLIRLRYLITLNLGHNKIQTLKAKDFVQLVNLQDLRLDSNQIRTIENNVFENMASLTTVDLTNNALESIDQEIFVNATELTTVYLSRNRLKKIPKNMLKGKILFNFTIGRNELEGALERGAFEGLALVTELDLGDQHLNSVENYAFTGLQNLKTLLLNNNNIDLLSNYSFKGLQKLNCLDLSNNKIEKIDIVTEDLISLEILSLHHNKIVHISNNNFVALGSLRFLDLSHNNISHLGSNTFRTLQSLLNFIISNNPLCGSIEEKAFDGLSALPNLDVSGTLITTINNGSFIGMSLLRDLNVSHSNITVLQYNSLSYMNNIQSIDLSYNRIGVFEVNTTDLRYLKTLMLNNNIIKVISQTLFHEMSSLTTLILAHNHIRTVHEKAFYALKDICTLDLSYNSELKFDVSLVEKAQNLAKLFLSGTKAEVTFDSIKNIPLTNLEMAHSSIKNVSHLKLCKLQRLETLDVSNNAVPGLEVGSLSNLTALKQLDLSYNDLSYIQPGVFKDNTYLNLLNISHNKLVEVSFGIFRGLQYLDVLDLSYNKIKRLHRARFYDVEHLNTLIVDHNEIDFLSEDEFLGTSLSKLSIGGNPLPCEILANMENNVLFPRISAINMDETNENVKGVTCNKNNHNLDFNLTPANAEHDKLLLDIRNILYNVSKGQVIKEQVATRNDSPYLANITEQQQKLILNSFEMISSIKNLSVVSNMTSIINSNTNILLGKILQLLSSKPSISLPTSKPIVVTKENATSDNLLPYINKMKQDLENTMAIEKQNVLELDNKIERLSSRLDSSILTLKSPVHEKFVGNKEVMQKPSMFTEVCVGLILVILVGFILYKVYKSRLYLPSGRSITSSTRNIAESMESSHL